jgi:hypothetical protein
MDNHTENDELHLYGESATHAKAIIQFAPEISDAIQSAINEAWRPGEREKLEALQVLLDQLHKAMSHDDDLEPGPSPG